MAKKPRRRRRTKKPPVKKSVSPGLKRDRKTGRFLKGNYGGPGNPQLQQLAEYKRVVREAVTPKQLIAVLRTLLEKAQGGDILAAKILLDRTLGKVQASSDGAGVAAVELPTLANAADTVTASNAILRALGEGRLTPDDAVKYSTIVELARRTLETYDIAERLAVLERELHS